MLSYEPLLTNQTLFFILFPV